MSKSTISMHPLLKAFHEINNTRQFYADFLKKKGVDASSVTTLDAFMSEVPIIEKEDVFLGHDISELTTKEHLETYISAIVSSGTSGVFSYGLLTENDLAVQKQMIDSMMEMFFDAKNNPPLIINALPMGVSFVSSYPVIPVSVRADIATKVIMTLGKERQVVIVTSPHILQQILKEGIAQGVVWGEYRIASVIGGEAFSNSLVQYLQTLLNAGAGEPKNYILGTMGVTEVGLNIFALTPDLIAFRNVLQQDITMATQIFGHEITAIPEIAYQFTSTVYVEISDPDEHGVGDIVLTNIDTSLATPLIRYRTGDKGQFIERDRIAPFLPQAMELPIVAIYGRVSDIEQKPLTVPEVEEELYRDHAYASIITGHFIITEQDGHPVVLVHMAKGVESLPEKNFRDVPFVGVVYTEFPRNIELSYEHKWKHTS